jgi:ATP-dependent Clp protease ATP-binding subunit ClpA
MFQRFTDEARRTVVLAQDEARRLQHNYIGTEHVLLGLLGIPESTACRALRRLELNEEAVRGDIEKLVGTGTQSPSGHIPFTPRAKKVLELSLREALKLSHNYISTGHILLAIIREGEGAGAQVLHKRLGDLDKVRTAVRAEIGSTPEEPRPSGFPTSARTPAAEGVLKLAEKLAAGAPVGSHHLLEALARSHQSMAGMVLSGLGVDPDKIAAKLDTIEPEVTSDVTPEVIAARRMRVLLIDGEVHVVLTDAGSVELMRRLTELAGGELTGEEPLTGPFISMWTSTRDGLAALHRVLEPQADAGEHEHGGPARTILDRLRRRRRPPEHPERPQQSEG